MKFESSSPAYFEALRSNSVQNAGNGAGIPVSSSDPRVLELLGAVPAAAGVYVSSETAMRVATVYACVNRIAGGISTLPCDVYERVWEPERKRYVRRQVDDAPLWWLLNEQPTAAWTGAAHWERLIEHRLLRGDHFTEIRRRPDGSPSELVPLPWSSVVVEPYTLEVGSRLMYAVNDGLKVRGVDQDDMLHFPGFGFDGIRGRSIISQAARNAAGNAMAMDEYAGRFFAGGAHPSIVLQTDKTLNEQAVQQLRAEFVKRYSGLQNAHAAPLVLANGVKAEAVSLNAEDSQLLDARKFQVVDIARAFGVPPHLIGETSASTSWGSGLEALGRGFVMYTLAQHLAVIEQELNRKLFRTVKRFVCFDRSALMQGDHEAQSHYYRAALGGPGSGKGWMSVNDVRNEKNLPPLDGEDTIFDPASMKQSGADPKSPAEGNP
jgi:HK97 family phage portal protein